jgi:hypothetical protein
MSSLRLTVLRRGLNTPEGGATVSPTPVLPLDPTKLVEDTDYGVVKVKNGKLILDMQDFDADLGRF